MRPVSDNPPLPTAFGSGPHSLYLSDLARTLKSILSAYGYRANATLPKDGSELVQQLSVAHVSLTMTGDETALDPGLYQVVRLTLTGGGHTLRGIVGGSGQEGQGGRLLYVINTSAAANTLTLSDQDGTAAAADRFDLGGSNRTVAQGDCIQLWYDINDSRWRLLARN